MQRAVFMDRDGTITKEVGYVNHPSRLELLPNSAEAIRLLNQHGLLAIVATNQAGVARGYFPEERIHQTHQRLEDLLAAEGAKLDAIYYCPHHPRVGEGSYRQECQCRKPNPGMLLQAQEELDVDLSRSYMIGDKITDVEVAHRVGAKGIFVLTGYGLGSYEYERDSWTVKPDYICDDLLAAVQWILQDSEEGGQA
ncbi:MAG: HAD family hydrolase [Firmicutes bacterium]|nr:HAD family hydrolase [Bacillota bacterium]